MSDLRLHQIEGLCGSPQLVITADNYGRSFIVTSANGIRCLSQCGQGGQNASFKHDQRQPHQNCSDDQKRHKLLAAAGVYPINFLPLHAALYHLAVEEVPGVTIYIKRLRFQEEIMLNHL